MKKKYLLAGLAGVISLQSQAQKQQPNIIVFIADDLGWEDTSPYGNQVVYTPNIQRLANEGMKFNNFYLTASSSSPSRSSMFSSLYPHNTGAMNLHEDMKPEVELFVEPLRESGYYTMLIGKSHGTNNKEVRKKFDNLVLADWNKPWTMGDMWVKALKERPKDKAFFMWASSIDPHRPFKQGETPKRHNPEDVIVPSYYPDIPEMREELADYYDEISRFDEHIGMALKILEEQGILDNTLIMVITDNGKAFPQSKVRINVQGVKSPLIVRYPAVVEKESITYSLVSAVDLAPTILEMTGSRSLKKGQGVSFLPVLKDKNATVRDYAYAERNWHGYMAYQRAIITKDFLYIKNWLPELPNTPAGEIVKEPAYQKMQEMWKAGKLDKKYADSFITPAPAEELFYTKKDMNCMINLVGNKKYKKEKESLGRQLEKWRKDTDDIYPGKENLKQDSTDRQTGEILKKKT